MNIYTDRIPYTYLIGWKSHNTYYYGRRTAKGCDPAELMRTYFTSSRHVKEFRKKFGDPDVVEIRHTFNNIKKAMIWESRVLTKLDAAADSRFLNKRNGDYSEKFNTGKTAIAKTLTGVHLGAVSLDDPRWATGEIVGKNKGVKFKFRTRPTQTGKCNVRVVETGEHIKVQPDDPRWATGEIVGQTTGKHWKWKTPSPVRSFLAP